MPRYHLHIRSRAGILIDEEGIDASLDEAIKSCFLSARDLICGDVNEGRLDLAQSVLLADAEGKVIREIPFVLAINFEHVSDAGDAERCPMLTTWGNLEASPLTSVPVSMPAQHDALDDGGLSCVTSLSSRTNH
jgi:hypothetical protein